MEKQPINRVVVFGDFFDQHNVPGQVGHQWGAAQHRQRHQVERDMRLLIQSRLEPGSIARQPAQRPLHRLVPAFAADIGGHGGVDLFANARRIEPAEQHPAVRITKVGLVPRRPVHLRDGISGNPRRAIAAACEPHRVEGRIVGAFKQGREPLRVAPGKVAIAQEALLVEMQFEVRVSCRESPDAGGIVAGQ